LTSNAKRFYYRGVLHEYVDCYDTVESSDFAQGIMNRPIQDGARSKNPEKYAKDAETFENALKGNVDEKDLHRYHFYLAQSYRDSQQWEKAIEAYTKRAEMGGWNEEVFYSLFQVGRIKEILNHPIDDIIKIYFQAYQVNPWRAESLWAASSLCRKNCRFDQAFLFAKQAIKLKMPLGALFIGEPIYEWCALDEFSIAAYWTGRYKEARAAAEKLLAENKFPQDQRKRIEANHKFATDALLNGDL
jgi:tetratricopeptide (TPR) repeat protein